MAFNLFKHLMPPEEAFTPLFCEQAECIARGGGRAAADDRRRRRRRAAHVAAIREIEIAADAVARKIFIAANRTFNAPIDREDILALAHVLDDCVDLIEDTAKGIQRYGVANFPPRCGRWPTRSSKRRRCSKGDAVPRFGRQGSRTISALCEEVGQIEGRADDSFDAGLTRLRAQLAPVRSTRSATSTARSSTSSSRTSSTSATTSPTRSRPITAKHV